MTPLGIDEFVEWFSISNAVGTPVVASDRLVAELGLDHYRLMLLALALDELTDGEGPIGDEIYEAGTVLDVYHLYLVALSAPPVVWP